MSSKIKYKLKQYMEQQHFPGEGALFIVGLSGGVDSVVLLHLMKRLGYQCMAAHCNFHLRGEESLRDEDFASSYAASLDIPFKKIDFDTKTYASQNGISIEMAARDLRYAWFEAQREELGAEAIVVAHHREDSVETLLLNLIRGTGIKGLTGIKPKVGNVLRPLLCLTKDEILAYANAEGLSYVTDSSNLQDEFTRNKIRLRLLPLLKSINPSVEDALARTIDNLQQVSNVYYSAIECKKEDVFNRDTGIISISALKSFVAPEALLYEILVEYGFGNAVIKEVFESIDAQSGKEFYSEQYRLLKDRECFLLTPQVKNTVSQYEIKKEDCSIKEPVLMTIEYHSVTPQLSIDRRKCFAYLDAEKLKYPLILRNWMHGDRFVPFGMKGFQKLSDYFNNHKFSKPEKEKAWILCSGDDIVWIVGERIDNRFCIDSQTKEACVIKLF